MERSRENTGETRLRPSVLEKSPQSKRLLGSATRKKKLRRELPEPWTISADFYSPAQDINLPYALIPRHSPGHEPQIISSIKSFRKKN
jgi:hypothetical protein